jgi:hypothetical protein
MWIPARLDGLSDDHHQKSHFYGFDDSAGIHWQEMNPELYLKTVSTTPMLLAPYRSLSSVVL